MNAHGGSQFQPMLQLLEGYLDKKDVADEARYDKVREGAIVFLGTLARHLDPSDAKVCLCLHCDWQNLKHTLTVITMPCYHRCVGSSTNSCVCGEHRHTMNGKVAMIQSASAPCHICRVLV